MEKNKEFDVIIIGGSFAGLSAAMALGRSLRKVLIVDAGKPCNRYTPHSHNFIGFDGEVPGDVAEKARKQILAYPSVQSISDEVLRAESVKGGFEIQLANSGNFTAKRIVLATGLKDEFPAVPGFEECWGKSVIHCPYCHGYEFRDQPTIIMVGKDHALHIAALVHNLTKNLVLLSRDYDSYEPNELASFEQKDIRIYPGTLKAIIHEDGMMKGVILENGNQILANAMYAAIPFKQQSTLAEQLGCAMNEKGLISVNAMQATTVEGVYACGDNTNQVRSLAQAVASGGMAGAAVNVDLAIQEFKQV